jgi:23S rRNA (guanosine2251-2'-O)-methyltransferase
MKHQNTVIIYGTHAVTEALLNPDRKVISLFTTQKVADSLAQYKEKVIELGRPRPQIVERSVLDKKTKNAVHQGIMVECEPLTETNVQDLVIQTHKQESALILVLDQVTDPHNVGAIIRSASALGASGIVMQRKHAPELGGVVAKNASGAIEHIPVAYEINLSRAIDALNNSGFISYGLDERGTPIEELDSSKGKVVLVLGAEGKGLRPKVQDHCDALVRLPTHGVIQSLNVSNAAAIALYAMINR